MVGKVAAAVRREFDAQLRRTLPLFSRVKGTKGPPTYAWRAEGSLTFFVLLVIHTHWEWFTIELAWDPAGQFPWSGDLFESPFLWTGAGKRFRLVRLRDELRADYWWELAPKPALEDAQALFHPPSADFLLPKVKPLVRDAVHRICEDGVPYFDDVRRAAEGHLPAGFRIESS